MKVIGDPQGVPGFHRRWRPNRAASPEEFRQNYVATLGSTKGFPLQGALAEGHVRQHQLHARAATPLENVEMFRHRLEIRFGFPPVPIVPRCVTCAALKKPEYRVWARLPRRSCFRPLGAAVTGAPLHSLTVTKHGPEVPRRRSSPSAMIKGATGHGLDVTTECFNPYTGRQQPRSLQSAIFLRSPMAGKYGLTYKTCSGDCTGERLTAETLTNIASRAREFRRDPFPFPKKLLATAVAIPSQ